MGTHGSHKRACARKETPRNLTRAQPALPNFLTHLKDYPMFLQLLITLICLTGLVVLITKIIHEFR